MSVRITQATPSKDIAQRVAAHTHVKGLGLKVDGTPDPQGGGLIGQLQAREAAGYVVDLIKAKKFAGKAILLAGPPGTGKTALALAISQELGAHVPFCPMVGSEVYSSEVKKTEILMSNFRRAIGLKIKEIKEVFEGEVTALTPVEGEKQLHGYGRNIAYVLLGLKTQNSQKTLKLDPSLYEPLVQAKVAVGDVIYIESASNIVRRVGRCDIYASEVDLSGDVYTPLPSGEVFKRKEVIQELTLHDLDVANAKPSSLTGSGATNDIVSLLQNSLTVPRRTEITARLRGEVNKIVTKYINSGLCEVVPGVLFIDEVHMLDSDCHAFLNNALEQPMAPIVIFATNKGMSQPKMSEHDTTGLTVELTPHGLPTDLLDRVLIIPTTSYTHQDIAHIITLRAQTEDVKLEKTAVDALAQIGVQTSLRYVCQLLSPAQTIALTNARTAVSHDDVESAAQLFLDAKTSAQLLSANGTHFL